MKREKQFGGKHRVFLPEEMLEQIPEVDKSKLAEDQKELTDLMREGFNSLSDMQKRVIMLMVDQNMSERKVAKTLGIAYPTVLNHLNRARKKIKQYVMQNTHGSIYIAGLLHEDGKQDEAAEGNKSNFSDSNENP